MGRQSISSRAVSRAVRATVVAFLLALAITSIRAQENVAPPAARPDLAPARELVRSGKLEEAALLMVDLEKKFPDDPSLLLLRGEVLNASGKFADAIVALRRAAQIAPQKPRIFFNLGAALAATGDSTGAIDAFAKEIENSPDAKVKALAHINRGVLYQKDKKLAEAAAEIEAALSLDPERHDAFGDLIEIYLELVRPDDAAGAVERADAVGVRSARYSYRVGAAYFNQKAFDKAIPFFQSALELQPDMAPAELALARSLDQVGRRPEADPHFRRYLELLPAAPEAGEIRKRLKSPGTS